MPDAPVKNPFLQPGEGARGSVSSNAITFVSHIESVIVGEPEREWIRACRRRAGQDGVEARQDSNGRGGGRARRGQRARTADLIDRVDAVAATSLGYVQRIVEDRLSPEIVVLARFVWSRRIGLVRQRIGLGNRKAELKSVRLTGGALLLADNGGLGATAWGSKLDTRVVHDERGLRPRAVAGVAHQKVLVRPRIEDGGASVVSAVRVHRGDQ